ncbi:peptide ABC transporter substrate-binding protein [Lactobacillus kefiranofaciens]|uniref:peptide ABC transporter substrate-binding protein n=1 Tax=Lactobacillus kefiranofaciens TaxID=267818 RepID=UPI000BA4FE39|nr:peptide ABC transporter substrate-binding protein [Lactobacillus kefiranofaciens]MCJ2172502.1 peptide ABC transporter substrate-binding protein [Lactobacillus kefiranofaciens]MCP9331276.1 peptide ABC transporter substrate-binding protein [Lactobacillus kefiranofaciens]MDF4143069.1 peptide ABC transporter substrate-binding protein [Lactobacillus kefiranofaciens]PAK97879.1 peptide ABC transporter substrate-binding protein [Lactobacillus kefiranofaciens]QNT44390.1 peptide ABC transporter subst
MNKFHKLMAASVTVVAAGTLAACGNNSNSSSSGTKKTLNWMDKTEIEGMDLSKVTDATSFTQLNNTMEGLYRLGKNAKVKPGLATKTTTSKDGKTWTFILRQNDKWSNGDPVTAQDFVYSWRRTVTPNTGSQYSYLFSGVKNADAIVAGKKKPTTLGVKAIGKDKLVVTLDKRIPYFKLLMGFPLFFPQNQKTVEKYGKSYGTSSKTTVYNGPFVQKGWTGSNLSWKLQKNKHYWDKKNVKLDTINFSVQKTPSTDYNLYQAGKLDAALLGPQASKQLKHQKGYTLRKTASTIYLEMNQKKKPFSNENFRKAISLAVNRKELANSVGGAAEPADTLSPENMTEVNGKDYTDLVRGTATKKFNTYNKQQAQAYWKKAQKELGTECSFAILTYDDDASKKGGEFLQSAIESALKGVDVKVQSIPKKTALGHAGNGDYDVFLMGWTADFSDPISFLDLNTTHNSQNWEKYSDSTYDKLVAESKVTPSEAKRWDSLVKAEQRIIDTQGVTPLYHPEEAWMVRSSVKNVVYNGAGAPYNFKEAYVEN